MRPRGLAHIKRLTLIAAAAARTTQHTHMKQNPKPSLWGPSFPLLLLHQPPSCRCTKSIPVSRPLYLLPLLAGTRFPHVLQWLTPPWHPSLCSPPALEMLPRASRSPTCCQPLTQVYFSSYHFLVLIPCYRSADLFIHLFVCGSAYILQESKPHGDRSFLCFPRT